MKYTKSPASFKPSKQVDVIILNFQFSILHLFKILLKFAANILLVYVLDNLFPNYIAVFGGIPAYVILGIIITLLNFLVRPILNLITFPLHIIFTLFTTILVNIVFLWITYRVTLLMDPNLLMLVLTGGILGWVIISMMIGTVNWMLKHVL